MAKTKGHGGARPKVSDDDARGGSIPATRPDDGRHKNRHGSPGRKPKQITLKLGDVYTITFSPPGESAPVEMQMRVTAVEREYTELIGESTNSMCRISGTAKSEQ